MSPGSAPKMRLRLLAGAVLGSFLLHAPVLVRAADALWLQPSSKWLGIDGTWSTFEFHVGAPAQPVYLTVSTGLSEIWVIGKGGCFANALCTTARGGVFDAQASRSWMSLGAWNLGLSSTGLGGVGDYGLETIAMYNSLGGGKTTAIDGTLVASVNSTDYYQGYIGLGVVQGRFGNKIANPFISQLSETYGVIPSHSYGYTAGANHIKGGVPASLVLGGYDTRRFIQHDTVFSLDPKTRVPRVRIRGLNVVATDASQAPSSWNGTSKSLLTMNDSVMAVVDSSMPYLALPPTICDRFATALNLTFNETLGVYTYSSNSQFLSFQRDRPLSFTFSLSSWDNPDNFGSPLEARGVVNITVSSGAFAQLLQYPFKSAFNPVDPSVPYFPLRRASNVNEIVIGRVFMQEAYLITKYDEETFSLYQALFPENAATNTSVVSIPRSPNSQYPAFNSFQQAGPALTTGQTAGIVIAAFFLTGVCCLALWYCRRRQSKRKKMLASKMMSHDPQPHDDDMLKDIESSGIEKGKLPLSPVSPLSPTTPTSPMAKMFPFIGRRRRSRMPSANPNEMSNTQVEPAEVAADASHERYELPASLLPVELDGTDMSDTTTTADEMAQLGTEAGTGAPSLPNSLSPYEVARINLLRDLQGQLPEYTPPETTASRSSHMGDESGKNKSERDVSPVAHYRAGLGEEAPPVSAPSAEYQNANSLPDSLPSPLTPNAAEWTLRMFDLPSPMTVAPGFPWSHLASNTPNSNTNKPDPKPSTPTPSPSSEANSPGYTPYNHLPQLGTVAAGDMSRANSSEGASPTSPSPVSTTHSPHSIIPPSPTYQRTPIDDTRIICLGPLPNNVRLPGQPAPILVPARTSKPRRQSPASRLIGPGGQMKTASRILEDEPVSPPTRDASPEGSSSPSSNPHPPAMTTGSNVGFDRLQRELEGWETRLRRPSADTLGSNFTVEEQERIREGIIARQQSLQSLRVAATSAAAPGGNENRSDQGDDSDRPRSPCSGQRIDAASELVHVPQLPEKRYSWEADRR